MEQPGPLVARHKIAADDEVLQTYLEQVDFPTLLPVLLRKGFAFVNVGEDPHTQIARTDVPTVFWLKRTHPAGHILWMRIVKLRFLRNNTFYSVNIMHVPPPLPALNINLASRTAEEWFVEWLGRFTFWYVKALAPNGHDVVNLPSNIAFEGSPRCDLTLTTDQWLKMPKRMYADSKKRLKRQGESMKQANGQDELDLVGPVTVVMVEYVSHRFNVSLMPVEKREYVITVNHGSGPVPYYTPTKEEIAKRTAGSKRKRR